MRLHLAIALICLGILSVVFRVEATSKNYSEAKSLTLAATAASTASISTPTATVFYENGGPFVTYPLMCPKNIQAREGLSWRGITVGRSSLSDFEEIYGVKATRIESEFFKGSFAPTFGITLTTRASIDRRLAGHAQVCVVNWNIAALLISTVSDSELSDYIEDWVARFGPPEMFGWSEGNDWRYRDLIWPKFGLALHVDLGDASLRMAYATTVVFFPPLRDANDLNQWPYSQLRRTPPTSLNEGFPEELNPFDFSSMLATATAQASRTPLSSFTAMPTP